MHGYTRATNQRKQLNASSVSASGGQMVVARWFSPCVSHQNVLFCQYQSSNTVPRWHANIGSRTASKTISHSWLRRFEGSCTVTDIPCVDLSGLFRAKSADSWARAKRKQKLTLSCTRDALSSCSACFLMSSHLPSFVY